MSVDTLISDARGYTNSLLSSASSAMNAAINSAAAVGYSIPNYQAPLLPSAPPSSVDLTLPTLTGITLDLPNAPPSSLTFQDIAAIDASGAPVLTAVPPTIVLPTTPAAVAQFTGVAPTINSNIVFPDPPAALTTPIGDAPVLPVRTEPTAPQTVLPGFTAVAPLDNTVPPNDLERVFTDSYAQASSSTVAMLDGYVDSMLEKYNPEFRAQMAAIESQLSKYMAGGTGLNSAVENAIYERSRTKVDAEAARVRQAAVQDFADRGFTMPPGALFNAMQQARQAGADNNAQASREIVVMQAEMEQKNLQFAVTTSMGLRKVMLDATLSYHQNLVSINGQCIDYAKTVLNAVVEVYNTAVKAFTVKLDAYRAEAAVYETRLRGALAGIELYKAEVEALSALTNVDRAKVEVYRARIESLSSLSNVYRAQIDAVTGRVGLEKLRLDMFQSEVQAYSALVQAKNAEWQGYSAAIEGQTATAKIFATQVEGYNAQINGYKAKIDAQAESIRAIATTNQSRAANYSASIAGYSAVVSAKGEVARTQLENQRQAVVAFQAQTQAAVANAQVANEYYKAVSAVAIENAQGNLKAQVAGIDSQRAYGATLAQLGTANAKIYGDLASSAMSGMNTLASTSLVEA